MNNNQGQEREEIAKDLRELVDLTTWQYEVVNRAADALSTQFPLPSREVVAWMAADNSVCSKAFKDSQVHMGYNARFSIPLCRCDAPADHIGDVNELVEDVRGTSRDDDKECRHCGAHPCRCFQGQQSSPAPASREVEEVIRATMENKGAKSVAEFLSHLKPGVGAPLDTASYGALNTARKSAPASDIGERSAAIPMTEAEALKIAERAEDEWYASPSSIHGAGESSFVQGYLAALAASPTAPQPKTFQARVQPWMMACFGAEISADAMERNHRFLEESLELVQACGATQSEAHQLVDYVYGRPVGEKVQETGGVMVTLAALCLAQEMDMHEAGEMELARIWTKVDAIRAKQAAKPRHSPLPEYVAQPQGQDVAGKDKPCSTKD